MWTRFYLNRATSVSNDKRDKTLGQSSSHYALCNKALKKNTYSNWKAFQRRFNVTSTVENVSLIDFSVDMFDISISEYANSINMVDDIKCFASVISVKEQMRTEISVNCLSYRALSIFSRFDCET